MFRSIPVSNKLCFDHDIKRAWKIHQQKIEKLKSNLSNEPPEQFQFLDKRQKKIALAELRNMQVHRQNQALCKRIKQIDSKFYKTSYTRLYDNPKYQKKKTLNQPYRKRQLIKVVQENQQLLKRLQQKRSAYSIKKMQKERKLIEKNISIISEFPYKQFPQSRTLVNMWATTDSQRPRTSHSPNTALNYQADRQLGGEKFHITTYLSKGNFYLQLQGVQKTNLKYRIQLTEQKARQLLRISYSDSLEEMIKNLSIEDDKKTCVLKYSPQPNISTI